MELVSSSGTVITDAMFRSVHPLISFPATLSAADIEPYGYSIVQATAQPAYSPFYTVSAGAPTQVEGIWQQTWVQTSVSLASAQATQIAALSASCASAIIAGFTSSALGSVYTYPSKIVDQQNLAASVLASMIPNLPTTWTTPFWCANSEGVWARVPHTVDQIQQAGIDGKAAVEGYQAQNDSLAQQVSAATTIAEVQAIVWPT